MNTTSSPEAPKTAVSGKNVVVLCDGTANQVSVYSETNVLRLARRLSKTSENPRQVVFYDPGLGTEGALGALTGIGKAVTKFLGLAFGLGLKKNLADAYAFLMEHYEPGDRIYIFGFSRGAYTARALAGLLGRVGLLERGCNSLIPHAIKYYQADDSHQLNFFKKRFSRTYESDLKGVIPVHFLGVWDTVKSVGTLRHPVVLPGTDSLPNVINARHAVALDEKRNGYPPEIWRVDTEPDIWNGESYDKRLDDERKEDRAKGLFAKYLHEDIQTRWFAGVHSDVGGGYGLTVKDGRERAALKQAKRSDTSDKKLAEILNRERLETELSLIPLQWMMDAAESKHLVFDKQGEATRKRDRDVEELAEAGAVPKHASRSHNPLRPYWWVLGWKRRSLAPGAQLDESVGARMRDCAGYEPAARRPEGYKPAPPAA